MRFQNPTACRAVPTPFKDEYHPDITYIATVQKGDLIILESTSPVDATEKMEEWLAETRSDLHFLQQIGKEADVQIAYCLERVLSSKVMVELFNSHRVIIGGITACCSQRACDLYNIFLIGEGKVAYAWAEMCILTENSFSDVNITFTNELSIICDEQNIHVRELIRLANRLSCVNMLASGSWRQRSLRCY